MASHRPTGWLGVGMLGLCHGLSDFYATLLTPLVETFRTMFALSVTSVSALGLVVGVFGSMMQPVLGLVGDRVHRGRLAAAGLLVSAVFMSAIGLAPSAGALAALLVVGALGVAAFHPSGAALASRPGRERGLAVGLFLGGGGLGLALSPLAVGWLVREQADLPWLCVLAVPGVLFSAWVFRVAGGEERWASPGRRFVLGVLFERGTRPLWALFAAATLRSSVFVSFPFFLTVLGATRGWDRAASSRVLALFMACAVAGGMLGGVLARWVDGRWVLGVSCVAASPLFFLFASRGGVAGVVAFAAAGAVFGLGNPMNVALAQELRPRSASAVSGLMMGLAWGLANVVMLGAGAAAEHVGVGTALQGVAWLSAMAGLFVVFLPRGGEGAGG
ncbi:MAG: MFS transporter [Candidatus Brocadiia bacterium]